MGAPGSLHMVVEDLHDERLGADILADLGIDHFLAAGALIDGFLHHTAADGSHLRTVVGVHNRSHDVTTEGGTNLIEQVLIDFVILLVLIRANLQLRAVGGEAAGERGADARTQVAADDRSAHEADLRLLLLEEVYEDVRVGSAGVGEQFGGVEDEELVHAIRQDLVFHLASHHGVQLHTQRIGELATLGQQLLRYFLYVGLFYLAIDKDRPTPVPLPCMEGSIYFCGLIILHSCTH